MGGRVTPAAAAVDAGATDPAPAAGTYPMDAGEDPLWGAAQAARSAAERASARPEPPEPGDWPSRAHAETEIPYIRGWRPRQVRDYQRRVARACGVPAAFRDRLRSGGGGPELMVIPPGGYLMGSTKREPERDHDERQHRVDVYRPFALGRYAVTAGEFLAYCRAAGHSPAQPVGQGPMPVVNVTWEEVGGFLRWLSEESGRRYRLPTEEEWEYACRAGASTPFNCGDTITPDLANYNGHYAYHQGAQGVYRQMPTPVGCFKPNAFGLYDMHGNVWEWTRSVYDERYQAAEGFPVPVTPESKRVVRGGSWANPPRRIRSASRDYWRPDHRSNTVGFRVVRDL